MQGREKLDKLDVLETRENQLGEHRIYVHAEQQMYHDNLHTGKMQHWND